MTRHVLTVDLKDDPAVIDAYRAHHRRVWPEVLASLRRVGVREMEIYMLGRRLVMVVDMDGGDFRRSLASHVASSPRVAEWEALMQSLQQPPPGGQPGEWWAVMEPVFRLDGQEEVAQGFPPSREASAGHHSLGEGGSPARPTGSQP